MSQIVDDLRQVAIEIKTETQVGGNTAERVGGAFERVADALEGTQQIEDMDAAVAAVQQAAAENEQTIQNIVNSLAVVQTTGQSTSNVMSQKAVTDVFENEIGISPLYTPNQSLNIDDSTLYPRTAAVCTVNQWGVGGQASCIFIPVGNAKAIRITANSSANAAVGFVTKQYETGDVSPSWASGWSQALRITSNTYSDLDVPDDAIYLYVGVKSTSGVTLKPASIFINEVSSINGRLEALADKDEDINNELYKESQAVIYTPSQVLNLSDYARKDGLIGAGNTWNVGGEYAHIMIPVGNATQFSITANASYITGYAWLTEDDVAEHLATPNYADNETGRRTIDIGTSGNTLPTPPPSNAMYLLINAQNATGSDLLPTNVTVVSIDPNYVPPRNVSRITECENGIVKNSDKINALHGEYEAEDGDMNLNILIDGKDYNTNSFWYYPAIMSSVFRHKRIYYGFADNKGGSGVGCINAFDHRCWKTVLKKKLTQGIVDGVSGLYPDTHNIVCVQMLADRRLISCYSEGHGDTPYLCIRISKNKEDITEWEDVIRINMGDRSTYAQYHYINGKHYIFARLHPTGQSGPCDWAYVYSTDLETWSEPHTFLHQTNGYQYYIWLKPITDKPNMLRFAMYSNPTFSDMNLRCGIIDFENDIIYDYDGTTQVGTLTGTTINSSAFTILVNQPNNGDKQRLHDLAVTPFDSFKIAYSITQTPFIGTYRVYDYRNGSGAVKVLCSTGEVALNNNTTARNKGNAIGLNFINPDKLFIGRSSEDSTGNDFLQIWDEIDGTWTETKTVYSEPKGTEHLRNIYPLVDCNGRYAMWMRGYYNLDTYLGAETDFIVYDIENDVVF